MTKVSNGKAVPSVKVRGKVWQQAPMVHTPTQMRRWQTQSHDPAGVEGWVPNRGERGWGFQFFKRLSLAWHVFRGRYDALDWGEGHVEGKWR